MATVKWLKPPVGWFMTEWRLTGFLNWCQTGFFQLSPPETIKAFTLLSRGWTLQMFNDLNIPLAPLQDKPYMFSSTAAETLLILLNRLQQWSGNLTQLWRGAVNSWSAPGFNSRTTRFFSLCFFMVTHLFIISLLQPPFNRFKPEINEQAPMTTNPAVRLFKCREWDHITPVPMSRLVPTCCLVLICKDPHHTWVGTPSTTGWYISRGLS